MKHSLALLLSLLSLSLFISSCSDNSTVTKTPLTLPDNYDSGTYTTSTVSSYNTRVSFAALLSKLKLGRSKDVTFSYQELADLYAPLQPLTTTNFIQNVDDFLQAAESSSGQDFDPQNAPQDNITGGVYGGYLFDKYGRCIEENIQKGLFATMLYNQALTIINDGVTASDVDNLVALWGANPSFKNTDRAAENADVFCAAYAARRDKNDGKGLYTQMKKALIKAQAAVKAGGEYTEELNGAVVDIKNIWEKSQMATAINYLYSVIAKLSATSVDDAARASAMHSFGEAGGILVGWRAVNQNQRIVSDVKLDELLALAHIAIDAEPSIHLIWQEPFTELPKLEEVITNLQSIYGFTDSEMEDFKSNWVSVQNRL